MLADVVYQQNPMQAARVIRAARRLDPSLSIDDVRDLVQWTMGTDVAIAESLGQLPESQIQLYIVRDAFERGEAEVAYRRPKGRIASCFVSSDGTAGGRARM